MTTATRRPRKAPEPPLVWGHGVHTLRTALGLTQAELAEAAKVSQSAVSRLELGGRRFTMTVLGRVAAALDVPTHVLFPTEVPPAPRRMAG